MKTRILAKVEQVEGGWLGHAFASDGILATGLGRSDEEAVASLRAMIQDYLAVDGQQYLAQMGQVGSPDIRNCPEGAIKLPIDLWVCKAAKQTCPIQAQVFVQDREAFFRGCLLDDDRKAGIFDAVSCGQYQGFHHVRGRYLCPSCDEVHGSLRGTSYFYPWELSNLGDFTPFDPDRDMPAALRKGVSRASVLNALCAAHAIEIGRLLFSELADTLRLVELEIYRPGS